MLQSLRNRSVKTRQRFAFVASFLVTVLVGVLWFTFSFTDSVDRISASVVDTSERDTADSPFSILRGVGASVADMVESVTSSYETQRADIMRDPSSAIVPVYPDGSSFDTGTE